MSSAFSGQFVRIHARRAMYAAMLLLGVLGGCAVRQPADPARVTLAAEAAPANPALDWPARSPDEADRRIWMRPGKQRLFVAGLDDLRGKVHPYIWSGEVNVLCRRHAGVGLLCEIQRADQPREWYDPRVFMFYTSQTPVMGVLKGGAPGADPGRSVCTPGLDAIDGTPLDGVIYRLRPDPRGAPPCQRGIVLALRPLSGSTYTRSVVNELRARGWVVIESSLGFGVAGVGDDRDARSDADLDRFGALIGRLTNERLSEWAYGCEAMIQLVREERPALEGKPVLVLGFSAGAIGAPTVAARLGDQVKGVVLVGGGVNILRIAQTSSLSDFGLGVTFKGEKITGDRLDRLSDAYLRAATLDSFHTAEMLRRTPALMLQAADDDIVPVETGRTLYAQLGKPERWVFEGGHELLFLQLGWFDTKIADWVEENVPTTAAAVAPPAPSRAVSAHSDAGPSAASR
jgi:fermentation-respiration switch protein FrsA (DUF1100 family)